MSPVGEVTLRDVAQIAGVSLSTASRALNGSSRRVSRENEQRVREAAGRLGYTVDLRAQATARRRSNIAFVLVDALDDVASLRMAEQIRAAAQAQDVTVMVVAFALRGQDAPERIRMLRGQRPRTIFIVTRRHGDLSAAARAELGRYEEHGGVAVTLVAG